MLSNEIRRHRRLRQTTQADLAGRLAMKRQTVSRIESGAGTVRSAMTVIDALGLRIVGLPGAPTLGERIARRRTQRRLSQRRLAELARVSPPVVTRLEKRSSGLLANLERIAEALGSDLELRPSSSKGMGRARFDGRSSRHETPETFMQTIHGVIPEFDLDPCGSPTSHVRAKRHYMESDDGLNQPWRGRVWMNPPYSACAAWVKRAHTAVANGECRYVLALLPVWTSVRWFHDHVVGHSRLWFIKGRLKFGRTALLHHPFHNVLVPWPAEGTERLQERLTKALKRAGLVGST